MKQLNTLALLTGLFLINGCMSPDGQMYPKYGGQLVMYGDLPHSEIEEKQKEYIEQETLNFGTREKASLATSNAGWDYVTQAQSPRGNYASINLAVRMFNGAWILWEDNYQAFWGFGVCSSMRKEFGKSEKYFLKAIELSGKEADPVLKSDIKLDLALMYTQSGRLIWMDKAIMQVEGAVKLSPDDSFAYFIWAQALANKGEFSAAWEKIKVCEEKGGYSIPKGFINQLGKAMPRPK